MDRLKGSVMAGEPEWLTHIEYDRIEDELNAMVGQSLHPRGPDVLYDCIEALGLGPAATAVDVGCGAGRQALELARRVGLSVRGFDPLERYVEAAAEAKADALDVSFASGTAEALPVPDASADLVLYREVLYNIDDVAVALAEGRRVVKPSGRAVVYQLFNTDWLEPNERARFWTAPGDARNADVDYFENAAITAGFVIDEMFDLGGETVEWAEETQHKASRELLAASRILRNPEPYVERFGRAAVDIKLNDAFWFVYRMIGKLTQRIYVLRPR